MHGRTPTEILFDEYPGDSAWHDFADYYAVESPEGYSRLTGDLLVDKVMSALLGGSEREWFESSVPALGGGTPGELLLKKGPDGLRILKSLLMRMPT